MRALTLSSAVRPAARSVRRLRPTLLGLSVAAWLALCLAAGAWIRLETLQAGYELSALRHERARLVESNRKLELELARLAALDRVEAIAGGKLGMKFPSPDEVVKLP